MNIANAHEYILSRGGQYIGETCGCNGSPKKKQYKFRNWVLVVMPVRGVYYWNVPVGNDKHPLNDLLTDERFTIYED